MPSMEHQDRISTYVFHSRDFEANKDWLHNLQNTKSESEDKWESKAQDQAKKATLQVKCDERRPHCEKCTSTGRQCDGYSALPFSRSDFKAVRTSTSSTSVLSPGMLDETGPLFKLVADPAFANLLEKRYFQFFKSNTVQITNSLVSSQFWTRTLLQISHLEPTVKHAALALSAWHQYSQDGQLQHRDFANKQYQLALVHARNLLSSAEPATPDSAVIDKVLTACIVFICFESVRGNFQDSALHMDNGRAIMRQHFRNHQRLQQSRRRQDLVAIEKTLFRLDLPFVCFSDRSAQYPYTVDDFYATSPNIIPYHFETIAEAHDSLVDLCRWMLILAHHFNWTAEIDDRYRVEKDLCERRLRLWFQSFEAIAATAAPSDRLLVLNLRQWYCNCIATSEVEFLGPELRWDGVHHYFEVIINAAEEIVGHFLETGAASLSYDIGYIINVFAAATRCRDPVLRRRAIKVLKALDRQEGQWASLPAAAIAERFMEIEEAGYEVASASDIPEERRIFSIEIAVHVHDRKIETQYGAWWGTQEFSTRNEVVHW